jgi:two-component system CheB/CheR fusion protein
MYFDGKRIYIEPVMPIQLKQLAADEITNLLRVHEICLQIANWGGLGMIEQIRFATTVSEYCSEFKNNAGIIFYIEINESGSYHLKVADDKGILIIQKELPHIVEMEHFSEKIDMMVVSKEQSGKSYLDMQQFVFALTHDLKNSQTKLKLALALLETENIPDYISGYIHLLQRASTKLEATMMSVNKIIELGHNSADVVKLLSPAAVFGDVLDEFSDNLNAIKARVRTDFSSVNTIIYIEAYLKSIFSNLLSNSIKYAVKTRPPEISVKCLRDGDKINFIFSDNGQGIDLEKFSNKLFQPFTRFDNVTEGSGNGLYLIKNMIERNGGKIRVESYPGNGTTFYCTLQEYDEPPA